ncbi:MAG: hypothetical protein Q8M20_12430 [Rhodocyclaceae bacterium]|nr:hypothetical protein [Rhodocyclaceae bacterium]MDZ4213808.1 hypothetical protein [Rhodocyclaceae bacterium]
MKHLIVVSVAVFLSFSAHAGGQPDRIAVENGNRSVQQGSQKENQGQAEQARVKHPGSAAADPSPARSFRDIGKNFLNMITPGAKRSSAAGRC